MRGRVWTLLLYAVWLTWNEAEGSTAIAPVYSLPPTTSLDYPADDYAQLLTTPIQMQAEANGGFSILGKFFLVSSTTYPWRLFQMRNFDLAVAGALDIQFQLYQMTASSNYEFQFRQMRSSDTCHFSFPKLTGENSWYTIAVKYSTVDDSFELRFNNVIVLQGSCPAGYLENFELNRVLVQEQNWAGLRLYDSLLTDAEVASELDKICVPADTCTDVLTAGCDSAPACPLTCSDNTYATSGAVLAFNPDALGEIFDRSIPTEVDMGPVQWNVLDNGGVTLVSKLKFSASPSNYERVFAATDSATAGNALFQIMRRAETEAMFFIINDGDTSCLSDDIPITNEQWFSMLFQYDAATANIVVQLDGGTKHYKDCAAVAGFSVQNRLQNVNIFGKHGGSSPHFDGAIAGFYGFNSLLTSAEASLVLDSIVVGGDDTSAPLECTPCPTDGTVVAGCELPCHEPALSFNPDASQSMFDRADASGYRLPDQQMNFNTNGGFTLVAKFKFTGSTSGAEMILTVAGVGINLYFKRHSDLTMQMHVQYNDPDLGTQLCNLYNVPSVPQNVESTAIVVVDLSASTVSLDLSGVQHTASCDAGFTLPDIFCGYNQVGNGFWATDGEYFNGVVHGLYWYDRVLSGVTAADVLSRIKVDALDTVVDRCNAAEANCQDIPPTSSFSFEEGLEDETGSAAIQKIAGTGSTFVSDATHGQVLNVHNNAYRIDSPEVGDILDTESCYISFGVYF
jgi:hypothetical protein